MLRLMAAVVADFLNTDNADVVIVSLLSETFPVGGPLRMQQQVEEDADDDDDWEDSNYYNTHWHYEAALVAS